jgi:hypothetical protein
VERARVSKELAQRWRRKTALDFFKHTWIVAHPGACLSCLLQLRSLLARNIRFLQLVEQEISRLLQGTDWKPLTLHSQ